MTNKIYPYTTPANYTYDSDKIEIVGGIAKLKESIDFNELKGYWKFEDNVLDSSGQGNHGTNHGATFVDGKLDRCLSFDGVDDYVATSLDLQSQSAITITAWIKMKGKGTSAPKEIIDTIVSQYKSGSTNGLIFDTYDGGIGSNYNNGLRIAVQGKVLIGEYTILNEWNFVTVTYVRNTGEAELFVNGISVESGTIGTNWSDASTGLYIGCQERELNQHANGLIDEIAIYNRVLSFEEIQSHYNAGVGRHLGKYYSDKPTIKPTTSWNIVGLSQFTGFTESLGGGNQGNLDYQLSDDDGVSWKYWNGSAWVVATTQYNDVGTVHANIDTFPIANEKILFRAFLISDGEQQCELDTNEITALMGYPPVVYAGADKICNDHETKKPFSDATISDPDGDIEQASAWYDIEASGWINIPKGGYGTLQEAIRNFQYTYDNIGTVNCKLKIIDQDSKETIDDMNMNVHKYDVLFNIKDTGGDHLAGVSCNFGDGQGWQILNSPFHYYFDWKAIPYSSTFSKTGFIDQHVDVPSTNHTEDITMQEMGSVDPALIADAVWDELRSEHTQGGSYGNAIQEKLVDIKSETDKIQTDILDKKGEYKANITNLDVAVSTRAKETGGKIDDIKTETDKIQGVKDSTDGIKSETDKIQGVKNKTDNLPVDPSSETNATANKNTIIGEVNANETKLDNIDGFIKRLLGLNLENFRLFDMIYDANTNLLSGTIKVYANKTDCDNDVNPLAIYSITATYNANATLATYKVVKSP